ncbi:MAG: DUF2851 domain-containing protein [Bacteroidetes bacterium HGW-Bacteroidetes-2]|jgi:hypothetical protein|nr:MAG: DUF2851 domain-containing protein [Bacteroidetes bacterium HGW-Bacteroidetes-2]
MQEDFLHYIWEFQKFSKNALQTEAGEKVEIIHQGTHNLNSGPDFFNTQIRIDGQLWVGNVEIHLQSGDWYIHHHETDAAYDNVILHVVWEYNTDIYRKDNTIIPTLVLKSRIDLSALVNYKKLFSTNKKWINCEEDFFEVDNFIIQNWLERLYVERLESKSEHIEKLLLNSKNDWEAVLFQLLAKNFGLKVNSDSFLSMATSFDFSVVRKICHEHEDLESLFLGQVGLLEDISEEKYHQNLKARYSYLKIKFKLNNSNTIPVQFFRLRPVNFPTIRLAQLAAVYAKEHQLFSKVIKARNKKEIEKLFQITTLPFWDTHYNFKSISANRNKKISKAFVDLLIINTISPLQFLYFKKNGIEKTEGILELMASLPKEENQIVNTFNKLKFVASNAMQSQALIELKNKYCNPNKCLQCAVGNSLLQKK